MISALVIRTAGDKNLCSSIGAAFESPELRRLKLQGTVLRRNRDDLRRVELAAIKQDVEALVRRNERRNERRKRIMGIVPAAARWAWAFVREIAQEVQK